ncbi:MAG TPA: lanthionine synthetase C family protein [Thermoanaerobaculia bacterium]|nr:lanthionine synthetase C family protein [Thermoanaerobaculia bacterium]
MVTSPDTTDRSSWQPILEGDLALSAAAVLDEIVAALEQPAAASSIAPGRLISSAEIQASLALFFAYLASARPGRGYDDRALELLAAAIESTGESLASPGLYGGFTGVAWTLEHLWGRLFVADDEDPGEEVASALASHLGHTPWEGEYDLIGGLVGLGVYALERAPRPVAERCLEEALARLAESAERRADGIAWLTPPERMTKEDAERFPLGNYNVGVAHGVPGVVGLLGEICAAGRATPEVRSLLAGAVAWLLAQKLAPGAPSIFPYSVAAGVEPSPTRLAWCYGDLGISTSLLTAARGAGEPAWESEALAIARATTARPSDAAGVIDCGLCHGAAGNAHLYNRLYQATGDPVFRQAAASWFARMLAWRRPGEDFAGFPSYSPIGPSLELGWRADAGFLTGAAGIGLALLAALTPVEPAWDRLLLAAVPPRRPAAAAG